MNRIEVIDRPGGLAFSKVHMPTVRHQIGVLHGTICDLDDPQKLGGSHPEMHPLPSELGIKQATHWDGNYLFIHLHGRFFHDFLDSFSQAWWLKEAGETFTVVLLSRFSDIINSLGMPRGMVYGGYEYDSAHPAVYPQAFTYIFSFLEKLELPYIFASMEDVDGISCDYMYIPYVKTETDISVFNEAVDYYSARSNNQLVKYLMPNDLVEPNPGHYPVGPTTLVLSSTILEARIRFLRELFTPKGVGTEKIYVTRRNFLDRKNTEEPELESLFESMGYRCVELEKYPVYWQVEIITKAKEVAMFSGGSQALTYLCHPDTKILWLRPSEYDLKAEKDLEEYFSEVKLDLEVIEFNKETDSIVSLVREKFQG